MRIAISADDSNLLDSAVSPHFGRCPYYCLVDIDGDSVADVSMVANPYYGRHQPGQVPAFIHDQKVNVMLTGGMGRRAIQFFEQYGIAVATGASGTVREALESYLDGNLRGADPCGKSAKHNHSHGNGESGEQAAD